MEKAEARFADKQKKTTQRNKATAEYMSEAKLRERKTARLRDLRLAKQETDRIAGSFSSTPKKKLPTRAIKRRQRRYSDEPDISQYQPQL
ncbi:hypothetical protein C7I87_24835 [Mesorhizobium sp. SARCC-RB16n]|uniref:hypothetical protein n=1 Tax=Mesorhizobium sp. SARCC-RB16n TaxID=2116687 RepID=UPI00122F2519|nr:hypothetical protein [Mesorhizobium sp. SARCC-RB16n]KAA3447818.1 hypothetical protein C7I87_24835 [Mesorhizobium sp. SARCC-RB16n]